MSEHTLKHIFEPPSATNLRTERRKRLSKFYYDYRSELVFGVVLSAIVILSFWLSRYIPAALFDDVISPMQNASLATICLFGAWLLYRHHDGIHIHKIWANVLLLWAAMELILLVLTVAYDIPVTKAGADPLSNAAMVIGNVYAWLLVVYPTEVLRPGWLSLRRALLQVLPMPLLAVLDAVLHVDLRWLIALYPMLLLFWQMTNIHAYRKWCEDNYSSMERIDVQWVVRYMIMLAIVGLSYYYVCFSTAPARVFTQQWLLLFMMAYSTGEILYRRDPWEGLLQDTSSEKEEQTDHSNDSSYCAKLEEWMETERPWTNPDFRLQDLRQVLPLNRTYLSQLINSEYGCNFYQFVTSYRIAEAKRLMRENPEMKMQDVAKSCGFTSPTVFGRIFLRETGETPTAWIRRINRP